MSFFKQSNPFLSQADRDAVLLKIQQAEEITTGEIRVFIESRCKLVDPLEHAENLFLQLQMQNTENKNAVLIYIAYKDHDFAVFGDKGCMLAFPKDFWKKQVKLLRFHFFKKSYAEGLQKSIEIIGEELAKHFPNNGTHKNELPDEIIFRK